mmetsp:Transcript_13394/g.15789  ORF Transcript_13394/g.15789 Transcript_13394/m.15789 type:complete len:110 (-) Transcript_13394:192-521(-)
MTTLRCTSTVELEAHHERVERLASLRSDLKNALKNIQKEDDSPSLTSTSNNHADWSGFYVHSYKASFFMMDEQNTASVLESELEKVEMELVEACRIVQTLLGNQAATVR